MTSPSSSSAAATAGSSSSTLPTTITPQIKQAPWHHRALNRLNTALHHRYVYPIVWFLFWFTYLCITPLAALLLIPIFIAKVYKGQFFRRSFLPPNGRAILVTGCDRGFGHDTCKALAEKGWHVYAGCLTDQGIQGLSSLGLATLHPMRLDVTNSDNVAQVVRHIDVQHPEGLYALINNAGVGELGPTDWMDMNHFRFFMEVNYFAMVNMTKTCLPLLKKNKGSRIVNVTSLAGLLAGQPLMSAYSASKHAADSWSQALRIELEGWDIDVIRVNPSFHSTTMVNTCKDDMLLRIYDRMSPEVQAEYGREWIQSAQDTTAIMQFPPWDPINVVNDLVHAATATAPREQYIVGSDGQYIMMFYRMLPTNVSDALERLILGRGKLLPAARKGGNNTTTPVATAAGTASAAGVISKSPMMEIKVVDDASTSVPIAMVQSVIDHLPSKLQLNKGNSKIKAGSFISVVDEESKEEIPV